MIYLDTSALVKLVFEERESAALEHWLMARVGLPRISSDISTVELLRVCRRVDEGALGDAGILLDGIDLLPVDRALVDNAAAVPPKELRSLDAIHLASALSIHADLTAFVAYDGRLCSAAAGAGIEVVSPA
ncbi:MAG: type II toxin-antitoxin system VapC family toxin [Acidimicrobiales bacterium]